MLGDICQIEGCGAKATNIGSLPEKGIIDLCMDCYVELYKS